MPCWMLPCVVFRWVLPRVKSQVTEFPKQLMGRCQEGLETRRTAEQGNWLELTNGTWGQVGSETSSVPQM